MTTQDIAGLVERAKSWDRCYPGNLNVEMLVDDLTSALEHLAGEVERLRDIVEGSGLALAALGDTPAGLDRQGPRDSAG